MHVHVLVWFGYYLSSVTSDVDWLPVTQRIDFQIILIAFKILHSVALPYLSCLISFISPSYYNLFSTLDNTLLQSPSSRSFKTSGDRASQVIELPSMLFGIT